MAMPKNIIEAELVEKWEIDLDEEIGAYFLKGKRIPDLPKVQNDYYINKNRGTQTASKLKLFEKDPFAFFLKYELELDLGDSTGAAHFLIGNAVDCFVSYGRERFEEDFFIPDCGVSFKPDGEKFTDHDLRRSDFDIDEIQALITAAKAKNRTTAGNDAKLFKAQQKRAFIERTIGKFILTPADGETVNRVIAEMERQPLFDLHGTQYKTQVEIRAEFLGIAISGTLDREDVAGNIIRDTKSIRSNENQHFRRTCNMAVQEFGYDFSTSFYEFLRSVHNMADGREVRSRVLLDFFGKGSVVKFLCYEIPRETLDEGRVRILAVLHRLKQCFDEKDFPLYTEINTFEDGYLKAPYFQHTEAGLQTKILDYQPYDLDHA